MPDLTARHALPKIAGNENVNELNLHALWDAIDGAIPLPAEVDARALFAVADSGLYVPKSAFDAKGDLLVGTGADAYARKAIGAEGTVPVSRAAQATGIAWEAMASALSIYDRVSATADVTNTNAETAAYSKVIAANDLGATGILRLTMWGDYLNNEGATRDLTLRLKFGATTILTTPGLSLSTSANRRKWRITVILANTATNAQRVSGEGSISGITADTWPEIVDGGSGGRHIEGYGTAAEDTTAAKTLSLTAQHSLSTALISFALRGALLEKI